MPVRTNFLKPTCSTVNVLGLGSYDRKLMEAPIISFFDKKRSILNVNDGDSSRGDSGSSRIRHRAFEPRDKDLRIDEPEAHKKNDHRYRKNDSPHSLFVTNDPYLNFICERIVS